MSIVKVDQDKCIGCGACVAIDPENFDFNDEGISTVIEKKAAPAAKDAEEACPVLAIDVIEEEEEKCDCKHGEECNCGDACNCEDDCECGEDCECHHRHNEDKEESEDKEEAEDEKED